MSENSKSLSGVEIYVGEELCYTFPDRYSSDGAWFQIDCSESTAATTLTLKKTYNQRKAGLGAPADAVRKDVVNKSDWMKICGILITTEEAAPAFSNWYINPFFENKAVMNQADLCGVETDKVVKDEVNKGTTLMEVTLEVVDTGVYNLSHNMCETAPRNLYKSSDETDYEFFDETYF